MPPGQSVSVSLSQPYPLLIRFVTPYNFIVCSCTTFCNICIIMLFKKSINKINQQSTVAENTYFI